MELRTFNHRLDQGWSLDALPRLDSERTLVLAFGGRGYQLDPAALEELTNAYPRSIVVGCSSAGEISGSQISDDSLSVAVTRFERTDLRLAVVDVRGGPARSGGRRLAGALLEHDLRAVLLLSDGLVVNGTELLQGLYDVLPSHVAVTGGLAGDGDRFERTWVLAGNGIPQPGRVVAVGLYGAALGIRCGMGGGWDVFGPERVVTRSRGNVLHELDGEPALALYKTYLGDRAEGLPATALLFPLAIRSAGAARVVRTVLSIDDAAQTMTFAGDLPGESVVQLMRANADRLIEGANEASARAAGPTRGSVLTLAVSCVGRRLVLGERAEEEMEAVCDVASADTQTVGFYSYGEFSPLGPGLPGVLHNQTMTVTRLWEE